MTSSERDELGGWRDVVQQAVAEALDELGAVAADHPELRGALGQLTIQVLDDAPDTEPGLLGAYHGVPLPDRTGMFEPPSVVHVYVLPLVDHVTPDALGHLDPDLELLAAEARTTVLHEVGHHLGFDDADLDRFGFA